MKKELDILIRGGMICDGTGSEPFEGDVGIAGDRILFVERRAGRSGTAQRCAPGRIVEAWDLVVAPGFIDTHAHSEFTLLADPRAEGKICQGITTEINGNCGLSAAPLYREALLQREGDLEEWGIRERWSTFEEYFGILEKRNPAFNFVTLAGHGNLRGCVAGYRDGKLTDAESSEMAGLLGQSVREGAIGLSTGLIYPPGVYSDTQELIGLCRVLSRRDGRSLTGMNDGNGSYIYTSHMRSEGDGLIESIKEIAEIGREAGIAVHISHIKTSGERNWRKIDEALSVIESARKEGLRLTCDRYPYTAASTDLDTLLPAWAYEGGAREELERLKKNAIRERIGTEIREAHPDTKYWENVYVSSVSSAANKWMEGGSIASIAQREGREPVDMLLDLLIRERLRVGAIFSSMNEENLKQFLSLSYTMIGTDSSARSADGPTSKGKPHPRGFGSFPRFLGRYVRESSLMDLAGAIRRITLLPAETFGIEKRGVLKGGAFADIVVFNYGEILDRATYSEPFLRSDGVYHVIVNGAPVLLEGELTGIRSGRVLRHGR